MSIDTSIDFVAINIAVITISDSRTIKNDTSANTLEKRIVDEFETTFTSSEIPKTIDELMENLEVKRNEERIEINRK